MSVPGSTPPELTTGSVVRGRWGGWGADFPAVIFERESAARRKELGRGARLFLLSDELTRFVTPQEPGAWSSPPTSRSALSELNLSAYGLDLFGLLVDGSDDGHDNPDRVVFSRDRGEVLATLEPGQWSDWFPVTLSRDGMEVQSSARLHVIRIGEGGAFRIRVLFDALNRFSTSPAEVALDLGGETGPMVDFVDNFPAQLVHFPEDKATFLDEAGQSLAWHKGAVSAVYGRYHPDVFIHDTYTPNQMLTSRWWMGFLDPKSTRYGDVSEAERAVLWDEVYTMYRQLDDIVGEAMTHAGDDGLVVLSSDHGAAALNRTVRLNNLFASKGWLHTRVDPTSGAPVVDWDDTRVVFLNMYGIYLHPDGLGGP